MSYTKQTWVDNQSPLTAARMNYIETGIAAAGTQVCTSTTRPASPFAGMEIFETDTLRKLIYTGSAWYKVSGPTVGAATSAGALVNAANGAETTIQSLAFTASDYIGEALIGFGGMTMATNNAAQYINIYMDSTQVGTYRYHNLATGYNVYSYASVTARAKITTTGAHTVYIKANVDAGGNQFAWQQTIIQLYT